MKRIWIGFFLMMCPLIGWCQQQTATYNRKGDEAMKRQDYSDAKMWYEEGVSQCDPYSIANLTTIWLKSAQMRPSMRSLMNKCLNCLNVMATENDTVAVKQLITYYQEGIGTPKSEVLAEYWVERLESLRHPVEEETITEIRATPHERMHFFVGYSFSPTAPYGLTVGGVAKRAGWYVRFKTNMSFPSYEKGKTIADFTENASYRYLSKEANTYAATGGVVIKWTPWLYSSVGLGYGTHNLIYQYQTVSHEDINQVSEVWCKQTEDSFNGVAGELDFMVKLGSFFLSAGCNTINFKYVDLNAGLGVFF
ncbi:MAG: hypothetical protein ACI30I_07190 [Parabacteroides sp.]